MQKRKLQPHPTDPSAMLVPLARGKGFAVVDVEHADEVGLYNWSLRKPTKKCLISYAVTHNPEPPRYPLVFLHRLVGDLMDLPKDRQIDHHDRDGLNNRSLNLRPANGTQNRGNTLAPSNNSSGFKGVHQRKDCGKFVAGIIQDGRRKHLGTFSSAELAARAYDAAAVLYFGEFAVLNFPC